VRGEGRYRLTLKSLYVSDDSSAVEIMNICAKIFETLKKAYEENHGLNVPINSISTQIGVARRKVISALVYMWDAPIFRGRSNATADDAWVQPNETVLDDTTFDALMRRLWSWRASPSNALVYDQSEERIENAESVSIPRFDEVAAQQTLEDLSNDRPSENPRGDLYGYAPFARHLANSICSLKAPHGLVIGLYGPWGSGKSTVLNYVRYYIEHDAKIDSPIVVNFNPWWFSGIENLASAFISQLQAVLPRKNKQLKDLGKLLGNFGEGLGALAENVGIKGIDKIIRAVRGKPKDVPALKNGINEVLKSFGKTILVIIDDIDRLTSDEIRQLFKVIKALTDFPNVVYLLAFDRQVTAAALGENTSISGDDYLEKIIQVPFELPVIDTVTLRNAFLSRLNVILADAPEESFDKSYWARIYIEGIEPLIDVPRDIVRIINTLNVTYSAVKGEVNPVDFVAIEVVRVMLPDFYNIIRANENKFVGHSDNNTGPAAAELKAFHDNWLSQMPEHRRKISKQIAKHLFPKLQSVWSNIYYSADRELEWRRTRRMCNADIFPIYFRLALPEGAISSQEMELLTANTVDADKFEATLLSAVQVKRADGTSKARALLDRLMDYVENGITTEAVPNVIKALFRIGDDLLLETDELPEMFEVGNDVRVSRIIYHLLKRVDPAARGTLMIDAIRGGRALRIAGYMIGVFSDAISKPESDAALMDAQSLHALESEFASKMRQAAGSGQLLNRPHLPNLLARWAQWGDINEIREWAEHVTADNEGLISFVACFLGKTRSRGFGDYTVKEKPRLNPKLIEPYLDIDGVANRFAALSPTLQRTTRTKTAVDQYLIEYKNLKDGKNPERN